jgi:hypothetical protein
MHTLSIKYKKTVDENELWHKFFDVLGFMRHSGQLVRREMNPYRHKGKMMAVIVTATEDAIEKK